MPVLGPDGKFAWGRSYTPAWAPVWLPGDTAGGEPGDILAWAPAWERSGRTGGESVWGPDGTPAWEPGGTAAWAPAWQLGAGLCGTSCGSRNLRISPHTQCHTES